MLSLRKNLASLLLLSIKKFSQLLDDMRMVPLAVDVDSVFNSPLPLDVTDTKGLVDKSSLDTLKV